MSTSEGSCFLPEATEAEGAMTCQYRSCCWMWYLWYHVWGVAVVRRGGSATEEQLLRGLPLLPSAAGGSHTPKSADWRGSCEAAPGPTHLTARSMFVNFHRASVAGREGGARDSCASEGSPKP